MKLPYRVLALVFASMGGFPVHADNTAQTLPFAQDWSNPGLITTDDDWSGVPGFVGYRGDGLTLSTGVDPSTVIADGTGTPVDVIANQANPNTQTTGGIAEFSVANPSVALQGSGTASAPFLLLNLNTVGQQNITISYKLRDLDGSTDNSVQPVALHYRVGNSGSFTNVPAAFVADASSGPSLATLITPVTVTLPAALNNQPLVQLRWMTANAVGNDEWIGIDDITVTGDPYVPAPNRYSIGKHVVAGGGGVSSGTRYSVRGTVGQPEAGGTMTSSRYSAAGGFWSIITLVQTPGAPLLTITRTTTNTVILSWSSITTEFALQQNTNLPIANSWSTVAEPAVNNGAQISVTVPVSAAQTFFRLMSQ